MTAEIKGVLESPLGHVELAQKRILVQGWAYASDGGDVPISAVLDGGNPVRGNWGLARFDVFESEKNEYAYESGFHIALKLPETFDHEMGVEILAGPVDNTISLGKFSITRSQSRSAAKKAVSEANKHRFKFVPAGPVGSVRQTRRAFLDKLIDRGQLDSRNSVLEIGPGFGRLALPVTQYLQPNGRFRGLEILPHAVAYCNDHIGARYSNFRVQLADVSNQMYNKSGHASAANFLFPFEDAEFDLVYLQSVFTHMMFPEVANYLEEISRVLKPGGRCVATYYVLDDHARKNISAGVTKRRFDNQDGDSFSDDLDKPEAAVAFDERLLETEFTKHGMRIELPVEHGSWRGISASNSQDLIVTGKID